MQVTGERNTPIPDSPETRYERWHRYLYATQFSVDKSVLDLACGEGDGSYVLALNAQGVIGVDIRQETIDRATSRHIRDNLQFIVGSAARIPIEGTEIFDLIVSFETIEHLSDDEQHAFMVEVKRLLKKDGLFIVSTPNRLSYTDLPRYHNQLSRQGILRTRVRGFPEAVLSTRKPLGAEDISRVVYMDPRYR